MGRKGGERKKAGRGNEKAINAPQPYAGRGVAGLNRYEYVFLELFINRRIRSFLSHQKTMQFTNIIKTTVIISLQASATLLLISLKEKFGADRAKSGRKNRKEKCGKKIKGGNPRFEKIK
jgi:hypothetical protein